MSGALQSAPMTHKINQSSEYLTKIPVEPFSISMFSFSSTRSEISLIFQPVAEEKPTEEVAASTEAVAEGEKVEGGDAAPAEAGEAAPAEAAPAESS